MGSFLKIGGKYTDNGQDYAIPITVSENGYISITRKNETDVVTLFDAVEKRDAINMVFKDNNTIDLSEWTSCCILVENKLDIDASIIFYKQANTSSTGYLKNSDGSTVTIPLPHQATAEIIITPEDFPILNYIRYFKGHVAFSSAPTSGTFTLKIMRKR